MLSKAIVAATIASLLVVLESLVLLGCGKSPASQEKEGGLYVLGYTIVGGREYPWEGFSPDPDIRDYGIQVTNVLGSSPRLGPGESYVVEGTYALTDPEYNVLWLSAEGQCLITLTEPLSETMGQFRLEFRLPTDPLACPAPKEDAETDNVIRLRLYTQQMYHKGGEIIGTPTMTIEILL